MNASSYLNMTRTMALWVALGAWAGISGCATVGVHTGVNRVSTDLERRTGHALTGRAGAGIPGERSSPAAQQDGAPLTATPAGVTIEDGLSADEAVALALARNALFNETLADLGFSFADLELARQIPNPVLTILFPFPINAKAGEATMRQALDAIRFRKARVAAAELESKRVAERLVQNGLDLIRDVRVAFADLMAARQRVALADVSVETQSKLAQLMEARFQAGDVSKLDASLAGTETSRFAEDVVRQKSLAEQAEARLRALVGLARSNQPVAFLAPPRPEPVPADIGPLLEQALVARPDARAALLGVEAAAKRAGIEERSIVSLNGLLDANFPRGGTEFGPGADVTLPIFNANDANRARAAADVTRAVRQFITVRDRIAREVREAHVRALRAQELLETQAVRTLPATRDMEERALRAHELGEASMQVVLDARRQRLDASLREIEARADLMRAVAELERGVGERIPARTGGPAIRAAAPPAPVAEPVSGKLEPAAVERTE